MTPELAIPLPAPVATQLFQTVQTVTTAISVPRPISAKAAPVPELLTLVQHLTNATKLELAKATEPVITPTRSTALNAMMAISVLKTTFVSQANVQV
jgi:hypothetical protein